VSATPVTVPTAPGAPRNLVASFGNKQITLAWQAPSSNGGAAVLNYTIYRGTTQGGETLLSILGNVTTHVDTGLSNGQTYYYAISAINVAGEGNRTSAMRVSHHPPAARFGIASSKMYINTPITFTDASQGGDNPVVAWYWTFGDGANATTQNATHAYAEPGTYTITLIVRDENGLESNATMIITVVAITSRQGLMGITAGLVAVLVAGVVIAVKVRKKSPKRDWIED
jgi:PKD repeat protein